MSISLLQQQRGQSGATSFTLFISKQMTTFVQVLIPYEWSDLSVFVAVDRFWGSRFVIAENLS